MHFEVASCFICALSECSVRLQISQISNWCSHLKLAGSFFRVDCGVCAAVQ